MINTLQMGGAERVASILTARWVRSGHEVHVLTTFDQATEDHYPVSDHVHLHRLEDHLGRDGGGPFGSLRKLAATIALIRRERFSCVCAFLVHVNILAILAAKACGVPVVVSERTYPPAHRIGRVLSFLRTKAYPCASSVVMQTREGLQWLDRAIPKARGVVIPNPVAMPVADSGAGPAPDAMLPLGCKVLLYVGRLSPEKRVPALVEAFRHVADGREDWHFVVLGDGPDREAVQKLKGDGPLNHRLHIPGTVGNLDAWYRRADRFAFASVFEGFPNALAEAVCYGVPALAVDCPTGPRDLVRHGENGILLPRNADVAALADGLGILLDREFPDTHRHAARLRRDLAPDTVAGKWLELIEDVTP